MAENVNLNSMLNNSSAKGRGIKYKGKKGGLQDALMGMEQAAAIIRAVHYNRVPTGGGDPFIAKQELKKELEKEEAELSRQVRKYNRGEKPENRLDALIDQVEKGYGDGTEQSTPYGKPYSNRPKILRPGEENK